MRINYLHTLNWEQTLEQEVKRLKLKKDASVLNMACEYQLVPPFLKKIINEKNVSGIEINKEIVKKVPAIKYCNVDTDAFPFPDSSFDLILSIWGMEHFKTLNVLNEARRVLKPGGVLLFITPNLGNPAFWSNKLFGEKFSAFYYKHIMQSSYHPHRADYHFNSLGAIKKAATTSQLSVDHITYLGPATFLNYLQFSRTVQKLYAWKERVILTNRFFYRLKPYIVCALRKHTNHYPH